MTLVERLRAKAEHQRETRGDYLYRGDADPELEEAADEIERLRAALDACGGGWREKVAHQLWLGVLSVSSTDGHCVRIDFPNRDEADEMFELLENASPPSEQEEG